MRTTIKALVTSLIIGSFTFANAQEVPLDEPIDTVQLDAEGNVTGITFGNGTVLPASQADSLEGLKITSTRRVPFEVLKSGDPSNPRVSVVGDFVGIRPLELSEGSDAAISVLPGGRLDIAGKGSVLACPVGCFPSGGKCKCPKDVYAVGFPALFETFDPATEQFEVKVLMPEFPVGKP